MTRSIVSFLTSFWLVPVVFIMCFAFLILPSVAVLNDHNKSEEPVVELSE